MRVRWLSPMSRQCGRGSYPSTHGSNTTLFPWSYPAPYSFSVFTLSGPCGKQRFNMFKHTVLALCFLRVSLAISWSMGGLSQCGEMYLNWANATDGDKTLLCVPVGGDATAISDISVPTCSVITDHQHRRRAKHHHSSVGKTTLQRPGDPIPTSDGLCLRVDRW
jgi:hypothetical protein